jgi:hypothetical protein
MTSPTTGPVRATPPADALLEALPHSLRRLAARALTFAADDRRAPTRLRDAAFLARLHRRRVGHWPNFLAPRTFNEWILRRLIVARDPLHRIWNDKLAMRDWVAARIGPGHTTPLLAVLDDPDAIPWESLPPAFVIKATHGSRFNAFVRDAATADRAAIAAQARGWLARSYDEVSREWGYRGIPRRLLLEPLLADAPGGDKPLNVNAFVFDGRIAMLQQFTRVASGAVTMDAYDPSWRPLDLRYQDWVPYGVPPIPEAARATLVEWSARIGAGVDFLRLDALWDSAARRLWVCEVTPYPHAGSGAFDPPEWDLWLGAVWRATQEGRPWPPMPG